ncbi:vanadium-dependent haloperoxidase [Halobacillus shinanisalinarum]|uniref:Vanadium-dependent haloperoxidase n=1 Tax=Halobacillus shinanisalinarum TaxID=2932258 RepID=A0ABY4GXR3_9BACI|nr:vanadium-dependent haloperoxidase [Halobacillus shinanisalinarum]UOQ92982.1 vanadium-dependent haloperoxidase [Halobacillus shinanisalinarum]
MTDDFLKWSDIPYGGEKRVPDDHVDPEADSWPMYYLDRRGDRFFGPDGNIHFDVRQPDTIDWDKQLKIVQYYLENITNRQIQIAKYWGTGAATKQWTPVIDRLIDTYDLTPTRAARVLAAVHAGINDTFVVTWYYKYLWNVARPIQYDPKLKTVLCTPRFPTYISGHAAVSGCVQTMLSYFFPGEAHRLKEMAEENANSRLYGGVHFPIDNEEGLKLGRRIGTIITRELSKQRQENRRYVDIPFRENRNAQLQPPPYTQTIPYDFNESCASRTRDSKSTSHYGDPPRPKLYID